jgi:hypothetical protein
MIILPLIFLLVIFTGNPSKAFGAIRGATLDNPNSAIKRENARLKILSILENKTGDKKISKKAKEKLSTLSDDQTRLIISLSEVIANDGQTAGADIAFLLIMILIILS